MPSEIRRNKSELPLRQLGKTGLQVSIVSFGGGHFVSKNLEVQESIRLLHHAIDEGMNFMDTAWEYGQGESARRMGLGLQDRREKVVLMTKVCSRDAKIAEEQLHESLDRLKTDVIDVWQFHEINYDNDAELIFRSGGAIEAAISARDAGKIRFIGFTGHKSPHILQSMLDQDFDWDTCQLPINIADFHYRSFQKEILPQLNDRNIGVIGMKSLGGAGQLVQGLGLSASQCRRYALSLPISTLSCGIDSLEALEQDLEIGRNFQPMTELEKRELEKISYEGSGDGRYEWFKSTQHYDSQYHRDQHGFPSNTGS